MLLKKGSLYKISKNRTMFGIKNEKGLVVLNKEDVVLFLREHLFYHVKNNKILVSTRMLRESPKDYLYLLI